MFESNYHIYSSSVISQSCQSSAQRSSHSDQSKLKSLIAEEETRNQSVSIYFETEQIDNCTWDRCEHDRLLWLKLMINKTVDVVERRVLRDYWQTLSRTESWMKSEWNSNN